MRASPYFRNFIMKSYLGMYCENLQTYAHRLTRQALRAWAYALSLRKGTYAHYSYLRNFIMKSYLGMYCENLQTYAHRLTRQDLRAWAYALSLRKGTYAHNSLTM